MEFTHYENPANTRPPTGPVLKLWVRFTNLSEDQRIAPLDATLLFTRSYQSETDTLLANQLVLPADKAADAPPAYVLDHPQSSEWDLKGQRLGHRLKPGESLETYVPVDPESSAALTGDLVWRLHFRKGYNPQTGHGVSPLAAAVHALFFYVAISTFLLWACDVLVGFVRDDRRFIRDLLTGMMVVRA